MSSARLASKRSPTAGSPSPSAVPRGAAATTSHRRRAWCDDLRRQRQSRCVGSDDEVAGIHERQAEARHRPVHLRDDRIPAAGAMSRSPCARDRSARRSTQCARQARVRVRARTCADVAAGHEVACPAPRRTTTRRLSSVGERRRGVDESVDHRVVEHVEGLGTVERQRGHGAGALDDEGGGIPWGGT